MSWERAEHEDKGPKVAIWGDSGVYKTRGILAACHAPEGPPRLLVFDYEDSTGQYEKEFNFARQRIHQVIRLDDPEFKITAQERKDLLADPYVFDSTINKGLVLGVDFARVTLINRIAKNPIDHVSIESLSFHTDWEFAKWIDIYHMRETTSKGQKRDYYKLQPNDYANPNRVLFNFMNRLKALNVGVWIASHQKPKYEDFSDSMMKRTGDKPDAYKKLEFMMDTVVGVIPEEASGTAKTAVKQHTAYTAIVQKDRTNRLDKRFVWVGKGDGVPKTFLTQMADAVTWKGKVTDKRKLQEDPAVAAEAAKAKSELSDSPPEKEAPKEEKVDTPVIPDGVKVTKKQLKQIKWLKDELKLDAETWKKAMGKRKVTTARDFTAMQADELIANMYKRIPEEGIIEYRILFEGEKKKENKEGAGKDTPRDSFSDLD